MPIATPGDLQPSMLDRAKAGGYAYPAINVTSSETINAALRGFADAGNVPGSSRSRPAAPSSASGTIGEGDG